MSLIASARFSSSAQTQPRFQKLLRFGQRLQFLERRPVVVVLVFALPFAALVQAHRRESAGPVKVQVRIQVLGVEVLQRLGVRAGDVSVADQLADHRAVLAFHQRIVLAAVRAALGEFDQQLLQHFRHSWLIYSEPLSA